MDNLILSTQKLCNTLINANLIEDGILGEASNAAIDNFDAN